MASLSAAGKQERVTQARKRRQERKSRWIRGDERETREQSLKKWWERGGRYG